MESVKFDRQRGQILVQVALMVVVLFAFVALALDGGQIYGGRRRMQNAADAGALAGAREICFGGYATPEEWETPAKEAALNYAVDRNKADAATVEILNDYTVTVVASQTLGTFFAGVIGINDVVVQAEAAAACGGSRSGAGLWPLAFNEFVYTNNITCGQEFMVFASKDQNWNGIECAGSECECVQPGPGVTETLDSNSDCYEPCNCSVIGPHIRTSGLGWLLFPDPEAPFPKNECPGVGGCGSGRIACWLGHDYPGEIFLPACIAGQEGVVADSKVKAGVEARVGEVVRVPLWVETEEPCTGALGPCPGNKSYWIESLGCVSVTGYLAPADHTLEIPKCGNPNATCDSGKNLHIIKAVKVCDEGPTEDDYKKYCSSSAGSTSGVPPKNWETRSVSLIK
jgi:hypothetical protein